MRRFVWVILFILIPLGPSWAAPASFGTYHALVIGNNDYENLKDLKSAANDARAMAQLLKAEYGFKVRLLIDAKRADVIGALAKIRAKLTPNDNLLIYYAGHGVVDEYAEEGYWLPVDASKDDPSNWISNGDITNMVRAIRAKHVMVIADSCYSGTLVRAADAKIKTARERNAWLSRMNEKRSRTALVSGGLEPVIDSGGGGKHSVFAKALLDQLRENTDVLDGQKLFTAVGRPVALESDQTPQYSDIRRSGHEGGDFLFVRTAAVMPQPTAATSTGVTRGVTVIERPALPVATQANPAVELAFWSSIKDSTDPGDFRAYLSEFPTGSFVLLAQRRINKLKRTKVAALTKPTEPVVKPPSVADANGKWEGFLQVNQCEGFSGSEMELFVKDGEIKGTSDNGVQIKGKMISPTEGKGNATHFLGFGKFKVAFVDGNLGGTWYVHNSDAECDGIFDLKRAD